MPGKQKVTRKLNHSSEDDDNDPKFEQSEIEDLMDEDQSNSRTAKNKTIRGRSKDKPGQTYVRCTFCLLHSCPLVSLKRHVKANHPSHYAENDPRCNYVAPLDQTVPRDT